MIIQNMKIKQELAAGGIVYKKNQTVLWLICQHSQHKGWVFPKGLIGDLNKKESIEAAALRETEEEGGIKTKIIKKLPKPAVYFYKFNGQTIEKSVIYYLMEYVSGDPKNHDWEMSEALFLPENEVKNLLTYKSDKEAFNEALKLFNSLS